MDYPTVACLKTNSDGAEKALLPFAFYNANDVIGAVIFGK